MSTAHKRSPCDRRPLAVACDPPRRSPRVPLAHAKPRPLTHKKSPPKEANPQHQTQETSEKRQGKRANQRKEPTGGSPKDEGEDERTQKRSHAAEPRGGRRRHARRARRNRHRRRAAARREGTRKTQRRKPERTEGTETTTASGPQPKEQAPRQGEDGNTANTPKRTRTTTASPHGAKSTTAGIPAKRNAPCPRSRGGASRRACASPEGSLL